MKKTEKYAKRFREGSPFIYHNKDHFLLVTCGYMNTKLFEKKFVM